MECAAKQKEMSLGYSKSMDETARQRAEALQDVVTLKNQHLVIATYNGMKHRLNEIGMTLDDHLQQVHQKEPTTAR